MDYQCFVMGFCVPLRPISNGKKMQRVGMGFGKIAFLYCPVRDETFDSEELAMTVVSTVRRTGIFQQNFILHLYRVFTILSAGSFG